LKTFTDHNGPNGTSETTYSWDYGNAHFIVLNVYWNGRTGTNSDCNNGSILDGTGDITLALRNWLAGDLAANNKPFAFVFMHEPAFPYNHHYGNSLDANKTSRDAFWSLLESEKVSAVFSGHTHYQSKHQGDANGHTYNYPQINSWRTQDPNVAGLYGKVWQIDVGNAGQIPGDVIAGPNAADKLPIGLKWNGVSFIDVNVTEGYATINIYHDTSSTSYTEPTTLGTQFALADTIIIPQMATVPVIYGYVLDSNATPVADVNLLTDKGWYDLTDADGYYEIPVHYGWSGRITPAKQDYTFEPNGISYSNVTADIADQNYLATYAPDLTPPEPNPMQWAVGGEPNATGPTSITMTAATATDTEHPSVMYYFECTNYGDANSGWQFSQTYVANGLSQGTEYIFRVKARDSATVPNETNWSTEASATTTSPPIDTTPPTPNPMTWASVPQSVSSTSITMTATTASDTSLPVQYYFECTTDGSKSSGWQTSTTYVATGLTTGTVYTFRVKARDSAYPPNETDWSVPGYAMPISLAFVAAGTAVSGTGAITVAWPAHQAGDIAILFVESCGGQAATLSTPAGFVNVTNSPQSTGTGTAGTRITAFWCRATSSSMSSVVVGDPGDHVYGRILTFRNVIATGDPWDVTAGGIKATASTTTTFGTVTTSVDNTLIVLAASRGNDSTSAAWSSWTNANLSNLTERSDGGTTSGNGGGIGVATGVKATAGSTGQTTATVTSNVDGHMTIALKPADGIVTLPGQATNPTPTNGATSVDVTTDLSWTAGSDATSHDVYFGTVNPPPFKVNQTATTYDTGTMSGNTTYYWRIDEKNIGGTTTGEVVWSFTTAAAPPSPPMFVAAGAVASGTVAITPVLPSGIATNDILLLSLETANQAISIANQNGGTWTAVTNSPQSTGTAGSTSATRLTVFWSRYNGTQGAPTTSDSGDHQLGRIIAVRGAVASGNPWDVTAGGVEAVSDTSGSIPGATTTVANTLVVTAIATSYDPYSNSTAFFSSWANSNLTSLTERTDNAQTTGNGGGLGIATGTKATTGAYGNTAVTCASSSYKAMMSIAIKP
jgi:hypothetical protein